MVVAVDQSLPVMVAVVNAFPDAATTETIIVIAAMGGGIESLLPLQGLLWPLERGGIVTLALRLLWPLSNRGNKDKLEGLHGMEVQGGSGNDEQSIHHNLANVTGGINQTWAKLQKRDVCKLFC
jgi:hypothetical protein